MADISIKVVDAYFNDIAKLNPKIKDIKANLIQDLADGKIDDKELASEKEAFIKAGGNEAEFGKIMESALGIKDVSKAGFSPTTINFNTKGKQIEVTNDKNADFKKTFVDPSAPTPGTKKPETNFNYNTPESMDISRSIMKGAKTTIKDNGLAVQVNPKTKVIYMASKDKEKTESVRALQTELGVKVDGFIGPQTLKALIDQHKAALESGNSEKIAKLAEMAEKLGLDKAFGGQPVMGENLSTLFKANTKADPEAVTTEIPGVSTDITPRKPEELPPAPNNAGVSAKTNSPIADDKKVVTPTPVVPPTSSIEKVQKFKSELENYYKLGVKNPSQLESIYNSAKANGVTEQDIQNVFSSLEPATKKSVYADQSQREFAMCLTTTDKSSSDKYFEDSINLLKKLDKKDRIDGIKYYLQVIDENKITNKEDIRLKLQELLNEENK